MIFLYVVIYKGPWGLKNLIFQPFSLKNIKQNRIGLFSMWTLAQGCKNRTAVTNANPNKKQIIELKEK